LPVTAGAASAATATAGSAASGGASGVKAPVAAPADGGAVAAKPVRVAVQPTPPAAPEPAAVKASAPADAMATAEVHMDDADQAQPPPAASGSIEDEVFEGGAAEGGAAEGGAAMDPSADTAPAEAPADEVRPYLLTLDSDRLGKDEARLIATARTLERSTQLTCPFCRSKARYKAWRVWRAGTARAERESRESRAWRAARAARAWRTWRTCRAAAMWPWLLSRLLPVFLLLAFATPATGGASLTVLACLVEHVSCVCVLIIDRVYVY
jgi:hypothetical protein